jgi:hypothetical protein
MMRGRRRRGERSVDPLVGGQRQEFDEGVVVDEVGEDLRRVVVFARPIGGA